MVERDSYAPGTPSWIDIGFPDVEKAVAFYEGLFGWSIAEGPPEAGGYRMCMLKGLPVAGLGPQQAPGVPPWWTTYVSVADCDATAAAVTANGGTVVVAPMDVFEFGRMAVCLDHRQTMFSLWQPMSMAGSALVNEPGTLTWNELTTRDLDAATAFYGDVFGWTFEGMNGGSDYFTFHVDGVAVGGIMPMVGDMWPADLPDHWMVYFDVDDVDAMATRVIELGGVVSVPPFDVPGVGRITVVNDDQGAVFSLIRSEQARAGH